MLTGSMAFSYLQSPDNREYQLKAVFLFNFTQFVEWPAISFKEKEAPFIIGVLGKNPFGDYLTEAIAGENVNGHPLKIEYYNTIEEIAACHILFINPTEGNKIAPIIKKLQAHAVLTVSDERNFLEQGGMIRFFKKDNKIQLQINPEAIKAADLTISSKLLRLAEIFVTD